MLIAGGILVVAVVIDMLTTTISSSTRAGLLTTATSKGLWLLVNSLARRDNSPLLRMAGPFIVSATLTMWLVLLWLGWTLMFSADVAAVAQSSTGEPVGLRGRVLFTAYTLYTLGYGNYLPQGGWEIASALALINGLTLATLAITYLVPVVTAVTDRRRQAATISTAGHTPEDIVESLHDANGFGALDQLLPEITSQVLLTGQRHLSYPVMHHYRGADRGAAFAPSVAALDDAVTLLTVAVTGPQRPNAAFMGMWHRSVDRLLDDVHLVRPDDVAVPPPPSLDVLDRLGVEHVPPETYEAAMREHEERRRRLCRYVRSARWAWPSAQPSAGGGPVSSPGQ